MSCSPTISTVTAPRLSSLNYLNRGVHSKPEHIGTPVSWIQLRVRTATGDPDVWLVNWRPEDWIWDEPENRYSAGIYYINAIVAQTIKEAIE